MTSLAGPPTPLYERAARLWMQGQDTFSIARNLQVREHVIYIAMQTIRDIASDLRPFSGDETKLVAATLGSYLKRRKNYKGPYKRR